LGVGARSARPLFGGNFMWLLPFFKTIFKSLGGKPSTYAYPYAPMPKDPLVRGHVEIDIDACIFCTLCARKCPTDAIVVSKERRELEISHFQCIVCAGCVEVCPKKCIHMRPELSAVSDVLTKNTLVAKMPEPEKATKDTQTREKETVTADA